MATDDKAQLTKRRYQMPGTELGGEQVYLTALACAVNADPENKWQEYLGEACHHQAAARGLWKRALLAQTRIDSHWELLGPVGQAGHCRRPGKTGTSRRQTAPFAPSRYAARCF